MSSKGMAKVSLVVIGAIILGVFCCLLMKLEERENVRLSLSSKLVLQKPKKVVKPLTLSEEGELAYQKLLKTTTFKDRASDYKGNVYEDVQAFRVIMGQESADQAFKQLIKTATLPGQLYALCGLYFTDPNYFSFVSKQYKDTFNNSFKAVVCGEANECMNYTLDVSLLVGWPPFTDVSLNASWEPFMQRTIMNGYYPYLFLSSSHTEHQVQRL